MKKYFIVSAVLLMALLAGCASGMKDIKIETERDSKVDLKGYKTYMWAATAALLKDTQGQWAPPNMDVGSEVKFLVDKQMREKGFTLVNNNPDLYVAAAIGLDMDALKIKKDPDTKMEILDNVPQSALVITLIDADTGYLTWIGSATGEAQKKPQADIVKKRLDYAISKIFKQLPH